VLNALALSRLMRCVPGREGFYEQAQVSAHEQGAGRLMVGLACLGDIARALHRLGELSAIIATLHR